MEFVKISLACLDILISFNYFPVQSKHLEFFNQELREFPNFYKTYQNAGHASGDRSEFAQKETRRQEFENIPQSFTETDTN